jgi:hypothetical protein
VAGRDSLRPSKSLPPAEMPDVILPEAMEDVS